MDSIGIEILKPSGIGIEIEVNGVGMELEFKGIETKLSLNLDSIIMNKSKNQKQWIAQKSIMTNSGKIHEKKF